MKVRMCVTVAPEVYRFAPRYRYAKNPLWPKDEILSPSTWPYSSTTRYVCQVVTLYNNVIF